MQKSRERFLSGYFRKGGVLNVEQFYPKIAFCATKKMAALKIEKFFFFKSVSKIE
jgi:hypothetical protein